MAFQIIAEYDHISVGPGGTLGVCFSCGSPRRNQAFRPTGEILVDLGTVTDEITELDGTVHAFHRAVLCETCIRELTTIIGGRTPDQVEKDNITHWKTRARDAEKEVAELRGLLSRINEVTLT